jgi:hypothetical protein
MLYLLPAQVKQIEELKQALGAKSVNNLLEMMIDEYAEEVLVSKKY